MSPPSTPTKKGIWIFCETRRCHILARAVRKEVQDSNGMDSHEEMETTKRLETKEEVLERLGGESRPPPPAPTKKKTISQLSLRERDEKKRSSSEKKEEEPQGAQIFEMDGHLSPLVDDHYNAKDPRSAMEQRFTDIESIGKGNFGEVYRGRYKGEGGKWYAIKKSLESVSKAVKEVKGFRQIPPNRYIMEYVSAWLDKGLVFIQTELCDMSLLAYCRNGLGEDEIWRILVQIVLGLSHLHRSGFCHNDLKPDNILVIKGEVIKIKIGDFGLVSRVNQVWSAGDEGDSRYLAPEVFSQKVFTTAGDVFAAGMSVLEVTTGLLMPPQGDSRNILIGGGTPDRFFEGRSRDLREIIESMIRENPETRPSAGELLEHPTMKSYNDTKVEIPDTPVTSRELKNYRLRRNRSRSPSPLSAAATPKRVRKVLRDGKTTLRQQEVEKENESPEESRLYTCVPNITVTVF